MASKSRQSKTTLVSPLIEQLFDAGYEFDFPQVVTILEKLRPKAIPIGEGSDPSKEAFAISSRIAQSSSASEIQKITPQKYERPKVQVNFLGIAGVQGPLPPPFSELAFDRLRSKDTGIQDFLDIFNHRLISLWYRFRKSVIPGLKPIDPLYSPIGRSLLDLIGLFSHSLRHAGQIPERSLLYYAALLWKRPPSAVGLEWLLQSFFNLPVKIQQFVGTWQSAPLDQLTRVGLQGKYHSLGKTAILGRKNWDQTDGIVVTIGPLQWEQFLEFLPYQRGYQELMDLLKVYCGPLLIKRLRLQIAAGKVEYSALGKSTRLGYTTWLQAPKHSKIFLSTREVRVWDLPKGI